MTDIEFIQETLDDLAVFVRKKYAMRGDLSMKAKGDPNDLVTEVDLAVQEEIERRIQKVFPDDAIVGEENGMTGFPSGADTRAWVIDPIDGTQNFVRGLFPSYGISLGLAIGGIPVAGGVAVPGSGDLFLAERGKGAFRNGERIRVSAVDRIDHMRAEVDFAGMVDREATVKHFGPFIENVGQVRCHCAAVIGLCSIATGDMDAYVHVTLNPWDYAASMIVVQEAGGMVTRLDGSPINLFDERDGVLGSNGVIHSALSALAMEGAP